MDCMEPTARLLVIDDDIELCRLLQRFLSRKGYTIDITGSGSCGIPMALSGRFALVVLDVMMSGMSGFDVLRRIRSESRVPVVMLTAKGNTRDRVLGLELGADDYLPKPFDPAELALRIRAILRRVRPTAGGPIVLGDISIDPGDRTVRRNGEPIALTSVEFDILAALLLVAGIAIGRPELVREALGREFSPFDRSIDTHIYNLRRKLGPLPDGSERIRGVRGAGYLYVSPAETDR
jgi:two-component system, OmpR family, response regulator CpxR